MAGRATQIYLSHAATLRVGPDRLAEALRTVEITESVEDSKRIDAMTYPRIVISASGMATGGRVLHHLKAMAPAPRNTILFAGSQAAGTRGAIIVGGAKAVKIHGGYTPIRAQVAILENLSAHADAEELMEWLSKLKRPVRQTFVTHGEPVASDTLRRRIEERLRRSARVPEHGERVSLGREELPTTR
jgi:metallo-beta-lactamase family protein